MPNIKNTFKQVLKGTDYPDADYFWIERSLTNLTMIAKLIDRDKGVNEVLPDGKPNTDSLQYKIGQVQLRSAEMEIYHNDNSKKPKYKYKDKYSNSYTQTFDIPEEREELNAEHLKVRNEILDEYDKMCQRHADDPDFQKFKPMLDFTLLVEDPDRCNYPQAYSENPYIELLHVQAGGMPNFDKNTYKELKDELDIPYDLESGNSETPLICSIPSIRPPRIFTALRVRSRR